MQDDPLFTPTREAGLERLARFVPQAEKAYAAGRGVDAGPRSAVSGLSPWLRHRAVTEEETARAVLAAHGPEEAARFLSELFWRTYFKGFLALRPGLWTGYQRGLLRALDAVQTQSGLRTRWEAACAGETGIACFDAWAQDLAARGYLHNAARMSFASIWIFTLRLPWELGADFFLRHLADGDPASNTLSWRWVAGLHTPGKTYLTTPEIIEHVTQGRFRPAPNTLATTAEAVQGMPNPDPGLLPPVRPFDPKKPTAVILHEDDLCPDLPGLLAHPPLGTALLPASTTQTPLTMAPGVQDFRTALLEDAAQRLAATLGPVTRNLTSTRQIEDWAKDLGAAQIVTAWAPTGPVADRLDTLTALPLHRVRRPWDSRAWPHATAGYFKFRKSIPDLLAALS